MIWFLKPQWSKDGSWWSMSDKQEKVRIVFGFASFEKGRYTLYALHIHRLRIVICGKQNW